MKKLYPIKDQILSIIGEEFQEFKAIDNNGDTNFIIVGLCGPAYMESFYFLTQRLLELGIDINHIGLGVHNQSTPMLVLKTFFYEECIVAESIGGWNQEPVFKGSRLDCQKYLDSNSSGNLAIYSEEEWVVDYL